MNRSQFRVAALSGCLLLISVPLHAATGGAWMEIGPGGRAAGLAEAMTASVEGPTSTYWNPAAVGIGASGAEVMHASWIGGTVSQYFAVQQNYARWGLGASALHVGTGDLELRDSPSARPIGTFEARSYALGFSVARELPWSGVRLGATVRYLNERIYVYGANGWSMDLGLLRRDLLDSHLDLGATVRHIGHIGALNEEEYSLPMTYSAGGRYKFDEIGFTKPSVVLDVVKVNGQDFSLRAGAEAAFSELVFLRAGYATGYEARGLSLGFGLRWESWRFDYGYTPFGEDLGSAQRVSIGTVW